MNILTRRKCIKFIETEYILYIYSIIHSHFFKVIALNILKILTASHRKLPSDIHVYIHSGGHLKSIRFKKYFKDMFFFYMNLIFIRKIKNKIFLKCLNKKILIFCRFFLNKFMLHFIYSDITLNLDSYRTEICKETYYKFSVIVKKLFKLEYTYI